MSLVTREFSKKLLPKGDYSFIDGKGAAATLYFHWNPPLAHLQLPTPWRLKVVATRAQPFAYPPNTPHEKRGEWGRDLKSNMTT